MPVTPLTKLHTLRHIGLLASEVCTHGGIQSFMLRITEVIADVVEETPSVSGHCISLNDSSQDLLQHPVMSAKVNVCGANCSKLKCITHLLLSVPTLDVLFVGHVGLAPLAHVLKALGRVRAYYVILHGIEAWRRVKYMEREAMLRATGIIATTRYTAQECALHNQIPRNLFHIIPLCADERNVTKSPYFKLNGKFKLLCVARQVASESYKGAEHIFQALELLKQEYPGIHLNMVGQGNDQFRLKKFAEDLGVGPHVTFWGTLSYEDLAAAYEDCDVYVMPSNKEGFGIVFLEAMRRAKPCIGGNHGGTPEVIEHGKSGFLVEYGDVMALAESIRTLVENLPLRREMGEQGLTLITAKFSFQYFRASYEKLASLAKCP